MMARNKRVIFLFISKSQAIGPGGLFLWNGEPGGTRTRDHRIKRAPVGMLSARTCILVAISCTHSADECTAFGQNGKDKGEAEQIFSPRPVVLSDGPDTP